MTLEQINSTCEGKFVVVSSGVEGYEPLFSCRPLAEARILRWYSEVEGFENVFIYPCNDEARQMLPSEIACMFRQIYKH